MQWLPYLIRQPTCTIYCFIIYGCEILILYTSSRGFIHSILIAIVLRLLQLQNANKEVLDKADALNEKMETTLREFKVYIAYTRTVFP